MTDVKICGVKDPENLKIACEAGARFIGFVFYPPSPRYVDPHIAADLIRQIPSGIRAVGLFVDPDDQELLRVCSTAALDMIQLHGEETSARTEEIANITNLPVIKAIRLRTPEDVKQAEKYENSADWLLFDSKIDHDLPGGTGHRFDWEILKNRTFKKPWMLSGGLTPENIKDALKTLKPNALDVSSGVESSRGIKDPEKIKAFIAAAKSAI